MTEAAEFLAQPATRAEVVAAALRRMILSGELQAGSRLRQGEVSARFGVSTTPVREAFMALSREGLVHQVSHRGFTVLLPSVDDLRENFEIRMALEPLATRYATERVTGEQIDELQRLLDRAAKLVDHAKRGRLNRQFHDRLYEIAGRPMLAELIDNLRNSAEVFLNVLVQRHAPEHSAQTAREHQDILDAIRAGDAERASVEMREHLRQTLFLICEVLADVRRDDPADAS